MYRKLLRYLTKIMLPLVYVYTLIMMICDDKSNKALSHISIPLLQIMRQAFWKIVIIVFLKVLRLYFIIEFKFRTMGTSMTVPDSVKLRLARKILQQNENLTTNRITIEKAQNLLDKLSKISIQADVANISIDKLKEAPQTAITEKINLDFASIDAQIKQIQVKEARKLEPGVNENGKKENEVHSIWQNMTEQTKNHFKRVDERRKQSITVNSCMISPENKVIKTRQQSSMSQHLSSNEKNGSDLHEDKANQLLLSINSKFAHRHQTIPTKNQIINEPVYVKKEVETINKVIKKKILLPNVEIVNSVKQKRKLKYIYQDQEVKYNDDRHWRATS